jgi:hypothetical protein
MKKLVRRTLLLTIVVALMGGALKAAEERVCPVLPEDAAGAPAVALPSAGQEPLFAATVVHCCLEPFPAFCTATTAEVCAAAGARTFAGIGVCYRVTGQCEQP